MKTTSCKQTLPEGWSAPEVVADTIDVDGITVHRAGVAARFEATGEEITGSAAGIGDGVIDRAWFELLERIAAHAAARADDVGSYTVIGREGQPLGHRSRREVFPPNEAPDQWRYARSNGIALYGDWATACERAFWELAERDRILRSWHGEIRPVRLAVDRAVTVLAESTSYEWTYVSFPEPDRTRFSRDLEVVGVVGFPMKQGLPLALGFAARPGLEDAIHAAASEALQLLAFLWGEPLPETAPTTTRPNPMHHLDTYQVPSAHPILRSWLAGEHTKYAVTSAPERGQVVFLDISQTDSLRVAKAVCPEATPLVFGLSPFAAHLPSERRLHPIP